MFSGMSTVFTQYRGLSKSIWIIFFAKTVTNMGAFIWPMLMFIMSGKMGFSNSAIGIISAGTAVLFIPFNIIGGKLADKYNKKKLIIVFDGISIIFFIACAFVEPGIPMLIMFTIAGLFATMEWPAFDALFIEASKPNEREQVYSLSYLGMNLGLAFGAIIGGFLYQDHLSLAFVLDGLTTLASTVMIVLFVKTVKVEALEEHEKNEYEDSEEDHVSTMRVLLDRKPVFIMVIIFTLGSFIYSQWSFALPLYMKELFGDGEAAKLYGMIMSFNAFVVITCTPIITALLRNIKELPKVMIGIGLFAFSFLIIMNNPLKYVFFVMIFIFTIGEIVNTIGSNPYVSRRIPASHRGRVSSYMGIGYMVGDLLSRLFAGFATDYIGYDITFITLAIVGVLCVGVLQINYRLDKKHFPKLYSDSNLDMAKEEG